MKAKRIALAILLSVLMVVSAVLVVACKPDDPKKDDKNVKIDLLNAADWDGFNDETNYTISNNTDGSLQVDYEKSDTYQLFTRTMVDPIDDLAKIKKLVAKVKMTSDQATPELMFKFEGSDDPAAAEVTIQVGSDFATYEWTLGQYTTSKPYDLSKASALRVFADPGDATAKGSITFSEFYLSSEDPVAANTIKLPEPPAPPQPEVHDWNEIKEGQTEISKWEVPAEGAYTLTTEGDVVKVAVDKDAFEGDDMWQAMTAYVYGDTLATMKSFRIDIKGTADTTALIKPFDDNAYQYKVTFNGKVQHYEFDISAQVKAADADFSQKDFPDHYNRIAILALPEVTEGKTDIEISHAEFSTEDAKQETPVVPTASYPSNLLVDVINGWTAAEGSRFTVGTSEENHPTISWTAQEGDYSGASNKVALGANQYNYAVFEVKGTQGAHAIFRFGGVEYKFDDGFEEPFTGDWQTAVIKLTTPVSGEQDIIVMGGFKNANDAGTVEIRRAQLFYVANFVDGEKDLDVRSTFNGAGTQNYKIENYSDKTVISYSKPNTGWEPVMTWIDFGEGGYDKMTVTVKGIQGHVAVFSLAYPDDSSKLEKKFEKGTPFTGESETFEMDCSTYKGLVAFRIYLDFETITGVNENGGSIEITQAVLHKAA